MKLLVKTVLLLAVASLNLAWALERPIPILAIEDQEAGEVGKGVFGIVKKARYLGADVAVKSSVKRDGHFDGQSFLELEAEALQRIGKHPHIVELLGRIPTEDADRPAIVLSWAPGKAFAELKLQLADTPPDIKLQIAQQLTIAMAFVHSKDFVHGDLSDKNFHVSIDFDRKSCLATLLDFGLCREKFCPYRASHRYASPERWPDADGKNEGGDEKSDIWALGVVYFELLAGRHFGGDIDPHSDEWKAMVVSRAVQTPDIDLGRLSNAEKRIALAAAAALRWEKDERVSALQLAAILEGSEASAFDADATAIHSSSPLRFRQSVTLPQDSTRDAGAATFTQNARQHRAEKHDL